MKNTFRNPFADLKSSDEFELLCRDLLAKNYDVKRANKLFKQGFKQFGGDIIAYVKGEAATIVAQLKWYIDSEFTSQKIKDAVDEFLKHWDTVWQELNVKEFVLYVAQPLKSIEQHKAISEKKNELLKLGVEFDYVDQDSLKDGITPHRDIVRKYLDGQSGNYWEQKICGIENRAIDGFRSQSPAFQILNQNLEQKTNLLSEKILEEINPIRQLARSGRTREAIAEFSQLKTKNFDHIDAKVKAELLSLEIRISLPHEMETSKARGLLTAIKKEDQNFDTSYLEALITSYESGIEAGLAKLGDCRTAAILNLKLAFLINLGKAEEAFELYQNKPDSVPTDTETKRLFALVLLSLDKLDEAESIAEESFAEQPEWTGVRMAKAIVFYHKSLSPQILSDRPLAVAEPQPWNLIKTDEESLEKRREAAKLFESLLPLEQRNNEEQRIMECWYLACLADDPARQEEAAEYCRNILEIHPTHIFLIIWAVARNFSVDFTLLEQRFEEALNDKSLSDKSAINESLILLALYLRNAKITKAKRQLAKIKSVLEKAGENDLTAYWACQIALAEGDYRIVDKKLSNKIEDLALRRKVQAAALTIEYNENPNRKTHRKLTKRLQKLYRKTQNSYILSLYCQICHSQRNWSEVIRFGDILIEKTKALASLQLVCDAYYQNRKPERCLELLEKYEFIFSGDIPNDLNLLKTYCLLKTGKVAKATGEARQLLDHEKSASNLLAFIETHRHTGDIFSIEKAVQEMGGLDEIAAAQKLKISKLIAPINRELAQEIWRAAKPDLKQAKELTDTAFIYGNQIGLEGETGDLMRQMMDATKRGENSHQFLSVEEWLEMSDEQSKHLQEVDDLYYQGKTPTHFLCEQRNAALSAFYRLMPIFNRERETYKTKLPVMIRHGSRTVDENSLSVIKSDWNFYLDLSALLLLHHLGLLEKLETFAPIYISTETIPFLDFEIDRLRQPFPSRERAIRQIIKNLADSKCRTLTLTEEITAEEKEKYKGFLSEVGESDFRLVKQAVSENATVIAYLPIRSILGKAIKNVPKEFSAAVQDWRSVLKGLIEGRCLTAESVIRCQEKIDNQPDDETAVVNSIPIGSTTYLTGLTAIELAQAGIFDEVCRYFQVCLDERDEQLLKDEMRTFEQKKETADWLKELQKKLGEGFEKEIYQGISVEKLTEKPPPKPAEILNDYRVEPLLEILQLKGGENDLAIIDDRWASGYLSVNNQTPIFTVYEILIVLKQNEIITENEYYENLQKLKNDNFRYFPSTAREILYHLDNDSEPDVNLSNGRFQRSPELKILRRYIADCFLDDDRLQRPVPRPGGIPNYAEIEIVFAGERAVVEAIGTVWRTAESIEAARNKADVLLLDFFVGRFGLRHFLPAHTEHEHGIFHFASDFAELCFQGIIILTSEKFSWEQKIERLEAYFDWLEFIFMEKFHVSEIFTNRVVEILATILQPFLNNEEETDSDLAVEKKATLRLIHLEFINHLPDFLRSPLLNDERLTKSLEVSPERVIYIGEMKFNENDLSESIAKALRNEHAGIALQNDKDKIFAVKDCTDKISEPVVKLSDGNSSFNLRGSFVGIHFPTVEQRLEFMQMNKRNLDCPAEAFETISKQISESENPFERTETYNRWARKSTYIAYENLANLIKDKQSFSWAEIRKFPLEELPKHFRLNLDSSAKNFENQFHEAAKKLLREEGIEETLNRYARFPIAMPQEIIDAFNDLPVEERITLLENFRLNWRSPVNKLHYIALALQSLPDDDEIFESAKEEIAWLLKPGEKNLEFEIFHIILRLIGEEFFLNSETKKWFLPIRLSLIWAHSSEIYNNIIKLTDDDPKELEKLLDYLNSMFSYWRKDAFFYEADYQKDYLHPNSVEREKFLGFAFGNLFADLSEELIEKLNLPLQLKEACFFENNKQMFPNLHFLKDFSRRSNKAGSFINECFAKFNLLAAKEDVLVFNNDIIQEYLLSAFEGDKNDKSRVWQPLILLSDNLPLNSKLRKNSQICLKITIFKAIGIKIKDRHCISFILSSVKKNYYPKNK